MFTSGRHHLHRRCALVATGDYARYVEIKPFMNARKTATAAPRPPADRVFRT